MTGYEEKKMTTQTTPLPATVADELVLNTLAPDVRASIERVIAARVAAAFAGVSAEHDKALDRAAAVILDRLIELREPRESKAKRGRKG